MGDFSVADGWEVDEVSRPSPGLEHGFPMFVELLTIHEATPGGESWAFLGSQTLCWQAALPPGMLWCVCLYPRILRNSEFLESNKQNEKGDMSLRDITYVMSGYRFLYVFGRNPER